MLVFVCVCVSVCTSEEDACYEDDTCYPVPDVCVSLCRLRKMLASRTRS